MRNRNRNSMLSIIVMLLVLMGLQMYSSGRVESYWIYIWGFIGIVILLPYLAMLLKRLTYMRSDLHKVDKMSGEEFEEFLAYWFRNNGYEVQTTPRSNDYGADLILYKDNNKIVVQVKRYSETVGISAVQQVLGALFYYHANEAWVITNNYYSTQAVNLAQAADIQLYDREYLSSMIGKKN